MCCAIAAIPPPDQITPDTPLRLGIAAALAFPDGSMTASGLRREGARGRLVIERIAGKDYTTLADIERMREVCRLHPKDRGCGSAGNGVTVETVSLTPPYTSSATAHIKRALAAAEMSVAQLKENSKPT
jgi:hypothetical protein